MRIVVSPPKLPTAAWLLLLMCWLPYRALAQSDTPADPKWEIGIQRTDLQRSYSNLNIEYGSRYTPFHGGELYILRRLGSHTFLRVAAGAGGKRQDPVGASMLPPNLSGTFETRYWAVSAEAAIGTELPQINRRGLNRLRFRASLGLSYLDLGTYRMEFNYLGPQGAYGIVHSTFRNSAIWQAPIMFQAGVRLAGHLHVGVEWKYGPYFTPGHQRITKVTNIGSDWGHESSSEVREYHSTSMGLLAGLSRPKVFLSFAF